LSGLSPTETHAIGRHRDLEHGDQRPRTRLCFNACRHDCLPSVRDDHDITGLKVRRKVLEEAAVMSWRR
jgi:hypothetical protein